MSPSEPDPSTRICASCSKRYNVKSAVCPFCGARGVPLLDFAAIAENAIVSSSPFVMLTWHPAAALTLDVFFDLNWGSEGLAPKDDAWRPTAAQQNVVASLGAFFGELMRREMGGSWQADPQHRDDVLCTQLRLPGGTCVYPIIRACKRMQCGAAESFEVLYNAMRRAEAVAPAPDEARGWMEQATYFERIGRVDLAAIFCDRASAFGLDAAMLADILRIRTLLRTPESPQAAPTPAEVPAEVPAAAPEPLQAAEPKIPLNDAARAVLGQAQALLGQADHAATLAAFDQLLDMEPAAKEGLLGRGRALLALLRVDEARIWLDSFAMRSDCEPERSLLAAMAADRAGDVRQAHDLLVRIADNHRVPDANRKKAGARARTLARHPSLLARTIEQLEDLEKAVIAYRGLCAQHPDYAEGWRDMGVALSLIGRGEEALPCFDRAAALEPSAAKSYDHKAVTLARLGRVDAAIATLDQGLRQSPGAIDLRFRKGVLLGNAGQHALALALFAEVVRDDPAHPDVWANQADIELREGRTADAMKSIERFLQNNPARIGPRMQAAREKLWSLRNPGVARDPERALELSDRARGMLVLFGDSVMALADLDAATHADPLNGYCWYNRASCLLQVGRVADALASCEQAESLLGATAEVTDLQIAAFMRLERVDDALLCHDRNLAYGKPAADRIHAKVITLMRGHRHGQALSLLQGLIARRPFDIGLRRERAEALAGLHRHADAVAAYDAAIALAPADLSLTAARAALAEKGP